MLPLWHSIDTMSQIELYLNNIRQKYIQLIESKEALNARIAQLEQENLAFKGKVEELKNELGSAQKEIVRLEEVVSENNKQGVGDFENVRNARTNQEIDALVKEIDQCIALLNGNK